VSVLAAAATVLTITIWPGGDGAAHTWRLRCGPAGGTMPRAATVCRRLNAVADPFAPVPKSAVCTQNYGGPQIAIVRGTFRGRHVWARFNRRNGCEIARWKRVEFLFP